MKQLFFILSVLLLTTGAFAVEKLRCDSSEGYLLSAKLKGTWVSDVTLSQNSRLIIKQYLSMASTKSYDMFQSDLFKTTFPYFTYSFYNNKSYILALPNEDLRNYEFVALLFTSTGEVELSCVTQTID